MKHKGNARKAAFKIILVSLLAVALIWGIGAIAAFVGTVLAAVAVPFLIVIWIAFAVFTLYFFRDPNPRVPPGSRLIVSPAHARVDLIDTTTEPSFMEGECRRVSMFLSVMDVHVQNAPITGKVTFVKYTIGQFINAMKAESAVHNENVLLGFESSEPEGEKLAVRLIAGLIARRIVPFVKEGDVVNKGERVSLIQFGSRADVYLPLSATIKVKIGDKLVGGESVLAEFE